MRHLCLINNDVICLAVTSASRRTMGMRAKKKTGSASAAQQGRAPPVPSNQPRVVCVSPSPYKCRTPCECVRATCRCMRTSRKAGRALLKCASCFLCACMNECMNACERRRVAACVHFPCRCTPGLNSLSSLRDMRGRHCAQEVRILLHLFCVFVFACVCA